MTTKWLWGSVALYAVSLGAIAGGIVNWQEAVKEREKQKGHSK